MPRNFPFSRAAMGCSIVVAGILVATVPSARSVADRAVRTAPGNSVPKARHNLIALEVFNGTLVKVQDEYVDPKRIDAKKMLYSALDSVQFRIPEVLVEPFPKESKIVVSVNNKRRTFSTARVNAPWRLSQELRKVFAFIQTNVSKDADLAEVEYAAVNGMLKTLDPHSVLLDPEAARDMEVSTSGKFGGLGIEIRMVKRKLTVIRPLKGTPAYRAGIKRGDHIFKINDELSENLTTQEAVDRMRGTPGTSLILWVKRKGTSSLLRFPITRAIIRLESVESRMLSRGVGYLTIKHFSRRTAAELRKHMSDLRQKGAKSWVLDLRWNPGGLLDQAIQVTDLFVDHGTIVTTVDDGGRKRRPRRATANNTDTSSPMVVLVNSNSASASEIVAGALKNLGRAAVVGASTFGKGSVQVLYDNDDGSKLKLTIGQYLTPGDQSIQSVGITPDIELHRMFIPKQNKSEKDQVRLIPTEHSYREKDLRAHLTSKYVAKPQKPTHRVRYLYDANQQRTNDPDELPPEDVFKRDFEIGLAERLLKAGPEARTRKKLLTVAKQVLPSVESQQAKKVSDAFAKLGITWNTQAPKAKPRLSANIKIGPANVVTAGTVVSFAVNVKNNGKAPAEQVLLRLKSSNPNIDEMELPVGAIAPGQSGEWTAKLKIPTDERDRLDEIKFELRSGGRIIAKPRSRSLRVQSLDRPTFAYSHQLIDNGNGDGIPQTGEKHVLRVTVKNTGKGTAKETTAILRNASGDGLVLRKARFELKELKPGDAKTVEFQLQIGKPKRPEIAFDLSVYDSNLHESVQEKLRFPVMSQVALTPSERFVKVRGKQLAVKQAAHDKAGVIGWVSGGSTIQVAGENRRWLKVNFGKRVGFIPANGVVSTRSRKISQNAFSQTWQVTPPKLKLNLASYQTTASKFKLAGVATDDSKVRDVYIFVSNNDAKVFNRKVFYTANGSGSSAKLPFEAKIPLWDGSNRVTVVVRENDKVRSAHTVYITRSSTPLAQLSN